MIVLGLWLLATIDAAFIGYREAAGRNALINKRKYYQRAMLRGVLFGQFAIAAAGIFILLAVWFSSEPSILVAELETVGARMLIVYVPFASIIFLAFVVRAIPSVDIKSITSTVIFGPFTLLRPFVAAGGIIYGLFAAPKLIVFLLAALVLALMLGLERVISRLRARNLIS
jgi:hypothetical protein